MPKGREISSYYSSDLKQALETLRSDMSVLATLDPYVRFFVGNSEFQAFISGTYFGHVVQQMYYVYVSRMVILCCKVLDHGDNSWGFDGCLAKFGEGTPLLRELKFLRARHEVPRYDETSDQQLKRALWRMDLRNARASFKNVGKEHAELEAQLRALKDSKDFARVRVFRSEKLAHPIVGKSWDRIKLEKVQPEPVPGLNAACLLALSDDLCEFAERFFGTLTMHWPNFNGSREVAKVYLNDYLRQLGYSGRIAVRDEYQ